MSSHQELAGRAFLQIFITTTLTYRLGTWLAFSVSQCWSRFAGPLQVRAQVVVVLADSKAFGV